LGLFSLIFSPLEGVVYSLNGVSVKSGLDQSVDYFDLYVFSSVNDSAQAINILSNKISALENFTCHFKEKAHTLIKESENNKIIVPEHMQPNFGGVQSSTSIIPDKLTSQQFKCLLQLVRGMTVKQIAATLELSPKTVEHYLDAVKNKLNCSSRYELISLALTMDAIRERI
jgi:DNA-binding NarL/FixJ family response regulator